MSFFLGIVPTKAFLYSDASIGKEENTFVGPSYVKTGGIFSRRIRPFHSKRGADIPFPINFGGVRA